ncbi:HopJ type III effector protein [Entomomonas moraniae]|uniref:HopJ type III effector protein n=1 Tax=Entomomonas moraniae TaxID=2213226 RepID=A0A3S9XF69_9GAMM|nr:HopJ type III effector protein [Entomomonas moraniae]AZS51030.1 HopJ type III effector protein [Entomomonas moraniae]
MNIEKFRQQLNSPENKFATTLAFINQYYSFQPTAFNNGEVENEARQNEGSCKVLALAILEGLSDQEALLAFAEHYRSVLMNPLGTDHQNIRSLQKNGLSKVSFVKFPLIKLNG